MFTQNRYAQIAYSSKSDAYIALAISNEFHVIDSRSNGFRRIIGTTDIAAKRHYGSGLIGWMAALSLSPDATFAITGSKNGFWCVDIVNERIKQRETGHEDNAVRAVAISPDGLFYATGGYDLQCKVWETKTTSTLTVFNQHLEEEQPLHIQSLAFSPDSLRIVSISEGACYVWDVLDKSNYLRIENCCCNAEFSPDGNSIVTSDRTDGFVYDSFTGDKLAICSGHQGPITCIRYSQSGNYIISSSLDKTCRIWTAKDGKEIHKLNYEDIVENVIWGNNVIVGLSRMGNVMIKDVDLK